MKRYGWLAAVILVAATAAQAQEPIRIGPFLAVTRIVTIPFPPRD